MDDDRFNIFLDLKKKQLTENSKWKVSLKKPLMFLYLHNWNIETEYTPSAPGNFDVSSWYKMYVSYMVHLYL